MDPPPGSAIDPNYLNTGTDQTYSKYVGAWQDSDSSVILTYSDYYPVPAHRRQYVSLSLSTGFRLPQTGLSSNTSQLQISIALSPPSISRSNFYHFAAAQASVLIANVSLTLVSADTLYDIFPRLPEAHLCAGNTYCDNCSEWTTLLFACGGACSDANLTQQQRDAVCLQWLGVTEGSVPSSSSPCLNATQSAPKLCHAFKQFCGGSPSKCPAQPLSPEAAAAAFITRVWMRGSDLETYVSEHIYMRHNCTICD